MTQLEPHAARLMHHSKQTGMKLRENMRRIMQNEQENAASNNKESYKKKKLFNIDENTTITDKTNIISGHWSKDEDDHLAIAVADNNGKNWKKIAEGLPGRSDVQCLHRWQKVLNPDLVKGPWTEEEDNLVIKLVEMYGPQKWTFIAPE